MSRLANIVWAFQRILAGQMSNLYEEAVFQAQLYKNIDPDTAKAIIAETHIPNCAMQ